MMVGLLLAAVAASDMPPDLARSVAAYHRATMSKDIGTLSRLTAPDYFLVNSDASTQRKASFLADFRVRNFRIEPYRVSKPLVRLSGDAALTGGEMTLRWSLNGRKETRRLRFAHLWIHRRGRWLLAYSQLTRMPE